MVRMCVRLLNSVSTVYRPPLAMYMKAPGTGERRVRGLRCAHRPGRLHPPVNLSFMSVVIMCIQELWWPLMAVIPVLLGLYLSQRL